MTTFYLVRHGQKAGGFNTPLSELGIKQAQTVAEFLTSFPIQSIIVSPLHRTRQSTEYIRLQLGIQVVIDELLRERVSLGDVPNQSSEEFMTMWRKSYIERDWQPPIGDSSRKSGARLQKAIENYSHGNDEHILFVTHAGIITDFLLNTFGAAFLNTIRSDFTQKNDRCIHEASITIIHYDRDQRQSSLAQLATIEHLPKELIIPK